MKGRVQARIANDAPHPVQEFLAVRQPVNMSVRPSSDDRSLTTASFSLRICWSDRAKISKRIVISHFRPTHLRILKRAKGDRIPKGFRRRDAVLPGGSARSTQKIGRARLQKALRDITNLTALALKPKAAVSS